METLKEQKNKIRKEMKVLKKQMTKEQKASWDKALRENVLKNSYYQKHDCIYAYVPLPTEAGDMELLRAILEDGKKLALPKVHGDIMKFYYVSDLSTLKEGAFHIMEPDDTLPLADDKDALILVPGTAFTRDGKRLGKGGGYYDKFLDQEPDHELAALAYDFQILADLTEEPHDRRVDMVLTPEHTYPAE